MLPSQGLSSGAIGYLHDVDQPDTVHLVVVNSLDVAIKDVQVSEGLQAKYRLNSKETNSPLFWFQMTQVKWMRIKDMNLSNILPFPK